MRACGLIIGSTVKESISGRMGEDSTVNGKTMIWKVTESTSGQMVVAMRASITMIRNVVTVYTTGLTVDDTKVGGLKVSNTGLGLTLILRKRK